MIYTEMMEKKTANKKSRNKKSFTNAIIPPHTSDCEIQDRACLTPGDHSTPIFPLSPYQTVKEQSAVD